MRLVGPLVLGKPAGFTRRRSFSASWRAGRCFGLAGIILAVPVALTIRFTLAIMDEEPVRSREGSGRS